MRRFDFDSEAAIRLPGKAFVRSMSARRCAIFAAMRAASRISGTCATTCCSTAMYCRLSAALLVHKVARSRQSMAPANGRNGAVSIGQIIAPLIEMSCAEI